MFYLKKPISYSRQNIDKSDIRSVSKTLKSNFLTTGPQVQLFENRLKKNRPVVETRRFINLN